MAKRGGAGRERGEQSAFIERDWREEEAEEKRGAALVL